MQGDFPELPYFPNEEGGHMYFVDVNTKQLKRVQGAKGLSLNGRYQPCTWDPNRSRWMHGGPLPRHLGYEVVGQSGAITAVGLPAPNERGATINAGTVDNTIAPARSYDTGTTSGDVAGLEWASGSATRGNYIPHNLFEIRLDATITNVRIWAGLFDSDPSGGADVSGGQFIGWRYDTGAGDTKWTAVCHRGTQFSNTPTVRASNVTPSANSTYRLRIDFRSGNNAYLTINDDTEDTDGTGAWQEFIITNIITPNPGDDAFPAATVNLVPRVLITTLTAASRRIYVSRMGTWQR